MKRPIHHLSLATVVVAMMLLTGCISHPANPQVGHTAIDIDPKLATRDYWFNQPPSITIVAHDFDTLLAATEDSARSRLFVLDRIDYRGGVITTRPMVSRQFFEPWRNDTTTLTDLAQSSLQTIRRTLRFEISRRIDNSWTMSPKVLVERYVLIGQTLTSAANMEYGVFTPSTESGLDVDPNVVTPQNTYWYAIGRDAGLEKELADDVKNRLR
jgi:hypothetical protein